MNEVQLKIFEEVNRILNKYDVILIKVTLCNESVTYGITLVLDNCLPGHNLIKENSNINFD